MNICQQCFCLGPLNSNLTQLLLLIKFSQLKPHLNGTELSFKQMVKVYVKNNSVGPIYLKNNSAGPSYLKKNSAGPGY